MSHKHIHGGFSSEGYLDAGDILQLAGLSKGESVVDSGCGNGYIALKAGSIVAKEGIVYAVDIHTPSITTLTDHIHSNSITNVKAVLCDASTRLPIGDGSIDVYLMVKSFHGFVINQEIDRLMDEIKRVLKKDGRVVIVESEKKWGTPGPEMDERLSQDDVESIMVSYGFRSFSKNKVGDGHHLGIFGA